MPLWTTLCTPPPLHRTTAPPRTSLHAPHGGADLPLHVAAPEAVRRRRAMAPAPTSLSTPPPSKRCTAADLPTLATVTALPPTSQRASRDGVATTPPSDPPLAIVACLTVRLRHRCSLPSHRTASSPSKSATATPPSPTARARSVVRVPRHHRIHRLIAEYKSGMFKFVIL